jgi:hypothetical protein
MPDSYPEVFAALKAIFAKHAPRLHAKVDTPDYYYLESKTPTYKNRPMAFGAVRKGKAYVSFHLMPVYWSPEVVKAMSPELKKRMQGKACFNFKTVEPKLFAELKKISDAGYKEFVKRKWL